MSEWYIVGRLHCLRCVLNHIFIARIGEQRAVFSAARRRELSRQADEVRLPRRSSFVEDVGQVGPHSCDQNAERFGGLRLKSGGQLSARWSRSAPPTTDRRVTLTDDRPAIRWHLKFLVP